jgi:hypothetical protein
MHEGRMPTYLVVALLMGVGYALFFYRRWQVQKAGGLDAHSKMHLRQLFKLSDGEDVTAAWSAVTVPQRNAGEKAAEVVGAATAALVGVGVRVVGRSVGVACTTKNRVLVLDREADMVRAFSSEPRPAFLPTGRAGTKRPSQTKMGWDDGTIVRLEVPGEDPLEIDIAAMAQPILSDWSRGGDVSRLTGPYPIKGSI